MQHIYSKSCNEPCLEENIFKLPQGVPSVVTLFGVRGVSTCLLILDLLLII